MTASNEVVVCADPHALGERAAAEFVESVSAAVSVRGRAMVVLSGGSTPRLLYERLADPPWRDRVSWQHVQVFWGDERWVPPDHQDSNYRLAMETLLGKVSIPRSNVHRVPTERATSEVVASSYERTLRKVFSLQEDEVPTFDLVLLGLGEDGHIASLFPRDRALGEAKKLVITTRHPATGNDRITFTPVLLNGARLVLFLVTGREKAEAVRDALEGNRSVEDAPGRLISPRHGSVRWILDRAAARLLPSVGQA